LFFIQLKIIYIRFQIFICIFRWQSKEKMVIWSFQTKEISAKNFTGRNSKYYEEKLF